MKIKRLLRAVLCLAMVIGLLSAMSMTASAADTYFVGKKYSAPTYEVTTDYGPSTWSFKVSDPEMVEFSDGHRSMRFLKPGIVTITTIWNKTIVIGGSRLFPQSGSFSNTYEVVMPTIESIGATTVELTSQEFVGGGFFPTFTAKDAANKCGDVNASFTIGTEEYSSGYRLPMVRSGRTEKVSIKVHPKFGYYFDKNAKYNITYNGKTYEATVIEYTDDLGIKSNYLVTYVDVTFAGGVIYTALITELDPPAHNAVVFDKTANAGEQCTVTDIKYLKDDKEVSHVQYGDEIVIRVYVEGDNEHTFKEGGTSCWDEKGRFSSPGVKVNDKKGYFDFWHRVEANDAQLINFVSLSVKPPFESSICSDELVSSTNGIVPHGGAEWTWWNTNVAGMSCDVKVAFKQDPDTEHFILNPKLVEEGTVVVNGVKAKKVYEDKSNPGIFYAEAELDVTKYAMMASITSDTVTVNNYFSTYVLNRPSAANFVGFYNAEDRLVGVGTQHIGGGGSIYFSVPKGAEYCKVMMWEDDGSINPMTEPLHMLVPVSEIRASIPMAVGRININDESVGEIVVEASGGKGEYNYKWQYIYFNDKKGAWTTWADVSDKGELADVFVGGIGTDTLKVRGNINTIANKSLTLRCVVSDAYGNFSTTDNKAVIDVNELPIEAVISSSEVWVPSAGSTDIAVVAYHGGGNYTYNWEYTENGSNWYEISTLTDYATWFEGIDTEVLKIKAPTKSGMPDGLKVRCRVRSDNNWSIKSDECEIHIANTPYFVADIIPPAYKIKEGKLGMIVATATGNYTKPLKYRWIFKPYGSDAAMESVSTAPEIFSKDGYNFIGFVGDKKKYPNGIQVQCIVSDVAGTDIFTKTTFVRFE